MSAMHIAYTVRVWRARERGVCFAVHPRLMLDVYHTNPAQANRLDACCLSLMPGNGICYSSERKEKKGLNIICKLSATHLTSHPSHTRYRRATTTTWTAASISVHSHTQLLLSLINKQTTHLIYILAFHLFTLVLSHSIPFILLSWPIHYPTTLTSFPST